MKIKQTFVWVKNDFLIHTAATNNFVDPLKTRMAEATAKSIANPVEKKNSKLSQFTLIYTSGTWNKNRIIKSAVKQNSTIAMVLKNIAIPDMSLSATKNPINTEICSKTSINEKYEIFSRHYEIGHTIASKISKPEGVNKCSALK